MSSDAKESRNLILNPSRHKLAEYDRQDWVITAEQGTAPEDLSDPGYWAHVSALMKPYDRIECRVDDGSWLVELVVMDCSRNWARVHVLNSYNLTTTDVSLTQAVKHKVEYKGPHLKHCVIRVSDSEVVKDGISSKADAMAWMLNHEKATS